MRVLTVLESVSRVDGGIFEAELALQKHLALDSALKIEVVGLRDQFTDEDLPRWDPIRPNAPKVIGPYGFGFSPELPRLLPGDVDLAYGALLWKYPSWALLNWQKRTLKPVVLAPHGSLDTWALQNSAAKKRIAAWLFKDEQLRRATCFRALCSAEADAIRAYGLTQRIEVVPNGVELPIAEKAETGNAEQLKQGKKRLLFLGRIHPKKGLVGLIRAWAELKLESAQWGEWQLVIAGWDQGGHEGELISLCSELGLNSVQRSKHVPCSATALEAVTDVVFHGPAFGEEKEQLLRSADAFVLPSFSEGLPMSVLEAWAYGLPVVMTPECNLPEGFASQAAVEIRNGDIAQWDGLREFIDMSDSDRIDMGLRGRRLVEEKFTWPKVASQMKAIYEEILGRE